jgi:hypothetical protein
VILMSETTGVKEQYFTSHGLRWWLSSLGFSTSGYGAGRAGTPPHLERRVGGMRECFRGHGDRKQPTRCSHAVSDLKSRPDGGVRNGLGVKEMFRFSDEADRTTRLRKTPPLEHRRGSS